jgi:hypothetical protein
VKHTVETGSLVAITPQAPRLHEEALSGEKTNKKQSKLTVPAFSSEAEEAA